MRAGAELFDPEIVFESLMPDSNATIVANGLLEVEAFMREFLAQWRDYCSTAGRGRTRRSSSPEPGTQSLPQTGRRNLHGIQLRLSSTQGPAILGCEDTAERSRGVS
jgi:hypothetical protein